MLNINFTCRNILDFFYMFQRYSAILKERNHSVSHFLKKENILCAGFELSVFSLSPNEYLSLMFEVIIERIGNFLPFLPFFLSAICSRYLEIVQFVNFVPHARHFKLGFGWFGVLLGTMMTNCHKWLWALPGRRTSWLHERTIKHVKGGDETKTA